LVEIAKLCQKVDVPHLVNNAYGVSSRNCMNLISEACRQGRVDAYAQSTDKNFLVPVGGAVVAGPDKSFITAVAQTYPGRASITPILDVFITLLGLGEAGFLNLLKERKTCYHYLRTRLQELVKMHGLCLLNTPKNDISLALSLEGISSDNKGVQDVTFLGSMLFLRQVSGARVVPLNVTKEVAGYKFTGWGSHVDVYIPQGEGKTGCPVAYLTAAGAMGMTQGEVDVFIERLQNVLQTYQKSIN